MIKVPIFFSLNKLGIVGAQKELKKLTNQTKSFGLTSKLSIGAASVALTAYTKKALSAAIADEKAQKALSQTLKNLGLAYSTVGVTNYVDSLQRATGVSEDLLRPSFQRLILVLGDVGKAQSALGLAMDISAGTGKDLSAVSMALAKGYSGQTTALSRLGAGLDKALLKSGDMEAITAKLSKLFAGQALVAAKTYAGQMAILGVASQEASERIGIELINSLISLGGQTGAENLAKQMERTATAVSEVIAGLTTVIATIKKIPILGSIGGNTSIVGATIDAIRGLGRKTIAKRDAKTDANAFDRGLNNRALDLATKIVAKKKEAAKIDKGSAATSKLAGMFDLDSIQIAEALKGNISDLDRARLEGMAALKTKSTDDDVAAIKKIEYETLRANAAANSSQQLALQNTFDFYKAIFGAAKNTADAIGKLSFAPVLAGISQAQGAAPSAAPSAVPYIPSLAMPNTNAAPTFSQDLIDQMDPRGAQTNAQSITVNLQGGINIGTQYEFYESVQRAVQEANRNGWSTAGGATG